MKHETGVVLWAKQSFVELDCVSTDQKVIYKKEKRKEEEKKKKIVTRCWSPLGRYQTSGYDFFIVIESCFF